MTTLGESYHYPSMENRILIPDDTDPIDIETAKKTPGVFFWFSGHGMTTMRDDLDEAITNLNGFADDIVLPEPEPLSDEIEHIPTKVPEKEISIEPEIPIEVIDETPVETVPEDTALQEAVPSSLQNGDVSDEYDTSDDELLEPGSYRSELNGTYFKLYVGSDNGYDGDVSLDCPAVVAEEIQAVEACPEEAAPEPLDDTLEPEDEALEPIVGPDDLVEVADDFEDDDDFGGFERGKWFSISGYSFKRKNKPEQTPEPPADTDVDSSPQCDTTTEKTEDISTPIPDSSLDVMTGDLVDDPSTPANNSKVHVDDIDVDEHIESLSAIINQFELETNEFANILAEERVTSSTPVNEEELPVPVEEAQVEASAPVAFVQSEPEYQNYDAKEPQENFELPSFEDLEVVTPLSSDEELPPIPDIVRETQYSVEEPPKRPSIPSAQPIKRPPIPLAQPEYDSSDDEPPPRPPEPRYFAKPWTKPDYRSSLRRDPIDSNSQKALVTATKSAPTKVSPISSRTSYVSPSQSVRIEKQPDSNAQKLPVTDTKSVPTKESPPPSRKPYIGSSYPDTTPLPRRTESPVQNVQQEEERKGSPVPVFQMIRKFQSVDTDLPRPKSFFQKQRTFDEPEVQPHYEHVVERSITPDIIDTVENVPDILPECSSVDLLHDTNTADIQPTKDSSNKSGITAFIGDKVELEYQEDIGLLKTVDVTPSEERDSSSEDEELPPERPPPPSTQTSPQTSEPYRPRNVSEVTVVTKTKVALKRQSISAKPTTPNKKNESDNSPKKDSSGFVSCDEDEVEPDPSTFKRGTSFRRSIVIEDEVGDKRRKSTGNGDVCVSVFFSPVATSANERKEIDEPNKAFSELNTVLDYIALMSLDETEFAKNYEAVKRLSTMFWELKDSDPNNLDAVLNYLVVREWPKVILDCMKKLRMTYPHVFLEDNNPESLIYYSGHMPTSLRMNRTSVEFAVAVIFDSLLKASINFTDVHEASRQACCEDGLIGYLLNDISPQLHNVQYGKTTAREMFLKSIVLLTYNCCKSSINAGYLSDNDCVEIFTSFRDEIEDIVDARYVNIGMLLALSYLIDDTNYDVIVPEEETIIRILQCLDTALEHSEHKYYDFTVAELTESLSRLASHTSVQFLITRNSGQEILHKVLKYAYTDRERLAACNALWNLSFCKEAKDILRGMTKLMMMLRDMKESDNSLIRRAASGVIWENEEKYDIKGTRERYSQSDNHVMISYERESESMIMSVRDELVENGFNVWMSTYDDEERSLQEVMMEGVEEASVVLIGVSRRYKQMPHAFAEGDYAQRLRKKTILLKLEEDYYPDSWLGDLFNNEKWFDFSRKSIMNGSLKALVEHVKVLETNMPDEVAPHLKDTSTGGGIRGGDVLSWTNGDVIEWLKENKLIRSVSKSGRLDKLQGLHLLMFYDLKKESPDYYYTALDSHLGFKDVLDTLEFTYALDRLLDSSTNRKD